MPQTSFANSLRAFVVAPLGASVALALNTVALNSPRFRPGVGLVIACGIAYLYALGFGAALVLPVLAFAPRSRRPPLWLGTLWGALAGLVAGAFLNAPSWNLFPYRAQFFVMLGSACGLLYAAFVRYPLRAATNRGASKGDDS